MKAPKLRFKEFSDKWEFQELGSVSKIFDGTHQTPNYVNQGIKFVSVENIGALYSTDKYITEDAFEKNFKNKPKKSDILMTRIGDIGTSAIVLGNEPLAYYVSLALISVDNIYICGEYLNQYISTRYFQYELHKRTIHVAFPKKINLSDIGKCFICFPYLAEQTKITTFLTAVDDKIAQLTEQQQLLIQYKKGVMQKIFNQEIRFKDDNGEDFGEWEKRELGELCSITTGKLDANAMVDNGKYRFYTCARDYYTINSYAFDTEALLISGNGANVGYIHYFKGKFNAYQRTYVLEQWSENVLYIKYFLEHFLKERINNGKNEGNTPYIVLSVLTDMPVFLPCIKEQTKIANFLTELDNKIDNITEQLTQAKEWKKGLLQQMFV